MSKQLSAQETDAGIPGVGRIPYGLHVCMFYSQKQDLIDSLVPFFKAGLENQERCLWITAPPFSAGEALAELRKVLPSIDEAISADKLRILDGDRWYAEVPGGDVSRYWLTEEETALGEGYRGLRVAGNTSFIPQENWDAFMKYEQSLSRAGAGRRLTALCTYDLRRSRATDVFEVTKTHHHTLCRDSVGWEIVDREFGPLGGLNRP